MLDKITFVNGTIVTSDYLNEVQKGTDFSGATPRADYYSVTSNDHNSWDISQRDKLKDYEIANPREEQETAIGRLAHDGIIMGYDGAATATWVLNDSTFSEPKCLPIAIGDNNSISVVETSQTHGVIVEAGKITLSDGTVGTWPRQIVGLIDETGQAFIYANEIRVAGVLAVQITISSKLPSPESNAYVPLAEINTTNGAFDADAEGNVMGTGVKDLRPNLYVGALNNYSSGVLKNTDILNQNASLNGWDRAIVDTRNGSVIITLPTASSDNDRVAIVDLEGSFDRYPVVLRPSGTDKINNSVDDWIINIRDAHLELFYHEATSEWRFEETPGSECNPKLGTFLSCGGKEFIGVRTAGECPDGQPIPGVYPNPSEGLYRFEAASGKCYKEVNSATAIYSNGEGGLIKVFGASRCINVGPGGISSGAEITKNIIYVDPATGDDKLVNNGTSQENPFRTIERALLEAARSSRRPVGLDAYDTTVIELAPGDYYVDNSPGLNAVGGPIPGESYIKQVSTSFTALNSWSPQLPYITIKANDSANLQPPALFNLGRTLYTRSGAVGTIYKIEKDAIASSIWRVYLQYVQGGFNVGEELLVNRLSDYNPTTGGLIVPRGISINGVDLRKVRIRPMYVPRLTPGSDTAQAEKTYIFKVTGGTYISLITFTDNQQFSRTHNTVTAIGYASEAEIKGVGETSYYTKIQSLFGGIDNWGVEKTIAAVSAETTIVAPLASSKEDRSQDREENQTGVASPDFQLNVKPSFPGPALLSASEGGTTNYFQLPDVNSTRSSSPYVFNCSVRSIFGLNGMWIDGSRVSGFKSMVSANYTQVSLQTDPDCFESPSVEYYEDPPRNKKEDGGKRYRACSADEFKYRHFGFRASFDAQVQLVSCFVIGNADHFISETGSDLSITNSCSDFGDISLRAIGYKGAAFSQDGAVQKGTYLGTKITEIIPPIPLSYDRLSDGRDPTLEDISVNTGIVIDYEQTLKYVIGASTEEETPSPMRIYVRNSNSQNPYTLNNPPSASDIGLGQFSYTRKVADGAWELAGGAARGNRNRIYINGFAREGDAVLYTGDLKVGSSDTTPGFDKLDDRSKVFTWDETAVETDADGNIINQGYWYFEVDTTNVQEETLDTDGDGYLLKKFDFAFKFKVKTPTTIAEEVNQSLDFIFDKSPIKIIRGADRRIEKERVYKLVFDGFLRTEGVRRPQAYYILEKQPGVAGGAINTGDDLALDPLVVTQVQTYNSYYGITAESAEGRSNDGKFIGYITQGSVAREVFTGDFIPTLDADEPELTEDPSSSITKIALSLMQTRPGIHYSVGALGPSISSIQIGTTQSAPAGGFLIETRRPSVIRSSGHTWEWTGYLNYDTSFPAFQGDPLEQDFALGKIIVEEKAGRVYATGMNEEGSYYLGTTVFDLRSGEQFSIPLKADNEIGGVTNQVLNNVVIKGTLLMQEDSQMVFGDKTKVIFSNTTEFTSTAGAITAPADIGGGPGVYATTERAGLVELATLSDIRGAFGSNIGVSANVAVTARDLAVELKFRDENLLRGGVGVEVVPGVPVEGPGGNPDDPADDIAPQIINIGQDVSPPTVSGGVYLDGTGANVVFQSVKATAEVSAFDNSISSDIRLKENVISLEGSLERLKKLEGVNYNFKAYPEQPRIGFIAQETAKVFPEILRTDDKTGMYSLAYIDLIPVLVESIKELSEKVKVLEEKLDGR